MRLNLGAALRARRARLGLRQAQVCEVVDITADYLSLLERGLRRPSLDLLEKLAGAYDMPLSALIADAERG